jgi:mannose-6-phosphate isomerase-like protein (cupin superfamily)
MTGPLHRQARGAANGEVDRRQAVQWLAVALAGLNSGTLRASGAFGAGLSVLPTPAGAQATPPVTFLNAAALRRAIRTAPEEEPGQPGLYSLTLSGDADYPVIGIRRTAPTRSEVHRGFTDVWYVLEGAGTLVTGGALVDGVETRSGEVRGRSVTGGDARPIRAGDFAVVPAGVPYWVSRVDRKGLLYIVVKVPAKP